MKTLRIVSGFMLMGLLLGLSLPASGFVPGEEGKVGVSETSQGDTVLMEWTATTRNARRRFSFNGEKGATYKVEWGDRTTNTYTGQGPDEPVECEHTYSSAATYTVLLYGVGTVK